MDWGGCFKRFDPERPGPAGLGGRLEERGARRCLVCLETCRGEDCGELCTGALDSAAAIARRLVHEAVDTASKTGLTIPEAVAVNFYMLLDEPDDCVAKVFSMRVLSLVAVELGHLLGMKKMLLLMAPAIAKAHECIGDSAFSVLDAAAPAIGRKMAERIAAALDEGVVKIRRVVLTFPPAKPT